MRAPAPSRRTTRIAGLVGACTLAIAALTGCIKVDADVTVSPEATGTGTFAFELQKEAAGFLGISDLDAFRTELIEGDLSADSGLGVFEECETSESETGYVYTCSFTDATFTDPAEGPWTIVKDGDSIVFTMTSDAQGTDAAATGTDDLLGDASLGSITVDVTFPGAITSITGEGGTKTSDTTATVSGSLTDTINVTITSEAGSSGLTTSALLVVLLGVAIVALIVIVAIVLLMRRRGSTDAAEEAEVAEAAETAETAAVAETVAAADAPTEAVEVTEVVETVETVEGPTDVIETVETTEVVDIVETADAPTEVVETVETVETVEVVETTEVIETVDGTADPEGGEPEAPRPPA